MAIVLGIAGLEILLQGPHFLVPIGLFRLPIGPLDARPIDLVLPLALAARILGRPVSTRVLTTLVLWMAFAAWYVFGAYWGFVLGNDTARLINQVRAVLILVGVIALVAGVPARGSSLIVAPRSASISLAPSDK